VSREALEDCHPTSRQLVYISYLLLDEPKPLASIDSLSEHAIKFLGIKYLVIGQFGFQDLDLVGFCSNG